MDANYTGKIITELRKKKGMTQKNLAEALHVTDKAVSKWERGLNFPELMLLENIAEQLDTTVAHLLDLDNATTQEVVDTIATISVREKDDLVRSLQMRSILKIIVEAFLFMAMIVVSKILDTNRIYGLAQILTLGMLPFLGLLVGTEIFTVCNVRRLAQSPTKKDSD